MYRTKSCTAFAAVCVASLLGVSSLTFATPGQANSIKPPVTDGPGGRISGGSRDPGCLQRNSIRAIAPTSATKGLTNSQNPTFFFYIPQTASRTAEFVLQNQNKQQVYKTTLRLSGKPGIVSFSLPSSAGFSGLEVGKNYRWFFTLICNPNAADRAGNPFVMGWIQRAQPNAGLSQQLRQASPRDRAMLYYSAGYWYEAVSTLAGLRRSYPNDAALASDWANLLQSAGLDQISREPIFQISAR